MRNDCKENNRNDFQAVVTYSCVFVALQESEKKCTDTACKKQAKGSRPSNDWTDAQWGVLKLEYAQPPAAVKLAAQ